MPLPPPETDRSTASATPVAAIEVVAFWRDAGAEKWFAKDEQFDTDFRSRFLTLHMAAAQRKLDDWIATAEGALALMILLDQFPRNAFRGTAHMYATDPLARHFARYIVNNRLDHSLPAELRGFCYLPFSHSESITDQQLAVKLNQSIGQPWLHHAEEHCRVIELFGRFPHRNPMFARETTDAEAAFLARGGFAG